MGGVQCGGSPAKAAGGNAGVSKTGLVLPELDDKTLGVLKEASDFVVDMSLPMLQTIAPEGTAVMSPLLVHQILAALLLGARGETAKELVSVLAKGSLPSTDSEAVHTPVSTLWAHLNSLGQSLQDAKLSLATQIWVDKSFTPLPAFTDGLDSRYSTKCKTAPLRDDPRGSVREVNAWAEDETAGLIKDLLGQDDIDDQTVSVLANALHFKGTWKSRFSETVEGGFHYKGKELKVPLMRFTTPPSLRHAAGHIGAHAVAAVMLPYKDKSLGMLIVLPDEGVELGSVEQSMTAAGLRSLTDSLREKKVDARIPKFEVESDRMDLIPPLKSMGVQQLFGDADLTGIAPAPPMYVSKMVQKAVIKVDEKGSEAAAATAVVVRARCASPMMERPVQFYAKRPFLFAIVATDYGCPLVVGRFCGPP